MLKFKIVFITTILLFCSVSYGQEQDGSVLERRVSIIQKDQPLSLILDQISWQAGVYFSYNASIVDADEKFTIDAVDKSLYTILNQILDTSKVKISEKENQIIISEKTSDKQVENTGVDSVKVKYFFLKGRVLEEKKNDPIPYATISVKNKPIGTISNKEGYFLLKLSPDNILDTVIISSMGYAQIKIPASQILDEDLFVMEPVSIRIKEVKVTATTPEKLLENIRANINKNYSPNSKLLTAFYRETVQQDGKYISVSEAVMQILKAPYVNSSRTDLVRLIKARRSPDVEPFYWLNFKLQGGPYTVTQIDVVKNMESFIDKDQEYLYRYNISKVIRYNDIPVYVLQFRPLYDTDILTYEGEMFVDRETYAIVHVEFQLNKNGLKEAQNLLIKKKPRRVKARPTFVQYEVNYSKYQGFWHLATARASAKFKVRSKKDNVNSEYSSVSDLLVTNVESTELKRFPRNESFSENDVFVEMINDYDEKFWENYNIIRPDEDLKNALKDMIPKP